MSRLSLRSPAALVLAAAAAACASSKPSADEAAPAKSETVVASAPSAPPAPPAAREWESWPPPQSANRTVARAAERNAGASVIRLDPKGGGYRIDELLDMISRSSGISFLYDANNATYKQARVDFIGTHAVPESELFEWLQAVLSYRKLVLVPVGPVSSDGKRQWFIMDQADPNLKSRPVIIDESEVFDFAERDGLYVVTSLRVRDTVDATRLRNALSPFSTQTAGIGRISDTGGRFILVGDFAPIVATMKRVLDRINAETPPSAAPQPTSAPK